MFRVRVDLKVPGNEIVVGRNPEAHHAHEDVYVAIRDGSELEHGPRAAVARVYEILKCEELEPEER